MNNCRKCRSLLIEALYDELNQEQKIWFTAHVQSCPKCAAQYQEMQATTELMSQRARTEPDSVFWNAYWDNLVDRMGMEEKSVSGIAKLMRAFWQNIIFHRGWIYRAATAVALIAIGVLIGKLYFGQPVSKYADTNQTIQIPATTVDQVSLQQRTDHYIERSKILLLGLINFDPDSEDAYALNLPYQKKISQQLANEANFLKTELNDPAQRQLRNLVEDLQIILLQIANLESDHELPGIELVKNGVERRGILLKINLEEMQSSFGSESDNKQKI